MRERASARLLVINPEQRVLLFHFVHHSGALAGTSCWATPGGGVEADETFAEAARRELWEETGIKVADVGPSVFEQTQQMTLPSGEQVRAVEHFFLVRVGHTQLSKVNWTDQEAEVLAAHHWWSNQELRQTEDIVWPEQLPALLERLGIFNH